MKKKKLIWQIPFLLILIIGTIIIIRQQHNTPYQKDTGFIFGTIYHRERKESYRVGRMLSKTKAIPTLPNVYINI
jgi:hypothetical protein